MKTKKTILFIIGGILIGLSFACQTVLGTPEIVENLPPTLSISNPDTAYFSIGDPYSPELGNPDYDALNYTITISLDPAKPYVVDAITSITLALTSENVEMIGFDFIGFDVQSVEVNGEQAEFQRTAQKLLVLLPNSYELDEEIIVVITYYGNAVREASRFVPFESAIGLFYPDQESIYIISEPDGARYWFPNNDHPRDKALFQFHITVPQRFTALANGTLQNNILNDDNTVTYNWSHIHPMATYLATIGVGDYTIIATESNNGLPINDFMFSDDLDRWESTFSNTVEAMQWFENMLGPYPFEAYGHYEAIAGGVALETQTMVVMSNGMLGEDVMIHELAHQWFGDYVSLNSWGEMWRNEGFATYFEYLWDYRDDMQGFNDEMDQIQVYIESSSEFESLNNLSPGNLFGYESYVKGAIVVHALRNEVGDEAFFEGLQLYFERFAYSAASDKDFQTVMEEISGKDLNAFFSYWLSE